MTVDETLPCGHLVSGSGVTGFGKLLSDCLLDGSAVIRDMGHSQLVKLVERWN